MCPISNHVSQFYILVSLPAKRANGGNSVTSRAVEYLIIIKLKQGRPYGSVQTDSSFPLLSYK